MVKKQYQYIYGPVSSWRIGRSLGIDLLSQRNKICNFNCRYCQVGPTKMYSSKRAVYVPTKDLINELKRLPPLKIDYVTFSGRGEPTLAKNIGEAIRAVKKYTHMPVAVLTNATLLNDRQVQKDLIAADFVAAKLDGFSPESFKKINRPSSSVHFDKVVEGILSFRKKYKGTFALQVMLVQEQKPDIAALQALVSKIRPDELQLNTPLRPSRSQPMGEKDIKRIKKYFIATRVKTVYDKPLKKVRPLSVRATTRRRGTT